jgi:transglutaminase-like putative cysteine protease
MLMPVASGKNVQKTDKAEIDYSNTGDGYVMVRYTAESSKRIKAQVKGPQATYTYNIPVGQTWTTLPLTAGNGSYKITVFQNVTGSKYAAVTSVTASVTLKDQFAPYLRPNQYVNYEVAPKTIAKAKELTKGVGDTMAKVEKVYNYVVDTLSYDYDKAATVKSGYLPSLDSVLAQKKGICFDYASLMTGMLRSQGVPCRLLIGYAGTQYHAWISVWTEEQGWVDGVIRFNGTSWQRMDPTFASTSQRDESIMDFIATDTNYVVSYQY